MLGRNRSTGVVLSKWEPPIQNRRVGTYGNTNNYVEIFFQTLYQIPDKHAPLLKTMLIQKQLD